MSPSLAKVQFNQSVLEAFSSLCPPPRVASLNVNTMQGFSIEAECVLDKDNKPLNISDYPSSFSAGDAKELPAGAKRLALVTAGFQDCLLGGQLSGMTALHVRLLEAMGYSVLVIKYTDWPSAEKIVNRVKYLDDIIKKVSVKKQSEES